VRWLSAVGGDDVVALMQSAGALVQPSSYEGFGLPVLEAMACGCPVVASDLDVLREITGGAARLVPVGDVAALGQALASIAASPALRTELAARGLERAAHFSWDRCARQTLEVYREAVR
jgi:alpha-1,3-rhamnosyl/mannosyltransferase